MPLKPCICEAVAHQPWFPAAPGDHYPTFYFHSFACSGHFYKWNHVIHGFLRLASLPCTMSARTISGAARQYGRVTFHRVGTPHFVFHCQLTDTQAVSTLGAS